MMYTVQKLADLAGVSARTLRYYDQIGLLQPAEIAENGYRLYGAEEVDRLQQILFYRELGLPLGEIRRLLSAPEFDRLAALQGHQGRLLEKRARLDRLLQNVQQSIQEAERGIPMQDKEKFEGFKRSLIEENERRYGAEVRGSYGDKAVDEANAQLLGLDEAQYREMEALGAQVLALLDEAFPGGNTGSATAQKTAETHRRWLAYSWKDYSAEAHRGLAEMYAADERFAAYYDRGTPGKAAFLRDAIHHWLDGQAAE